MTINIARESGRWKPPNSRLCTLLSQIKGSVDNERAHFQVESTGDSWQTISKPELGELIRMTFTSKTRLAVLFRQGLASQPL